MAPLDIPSPTPSTMPPPNNKRARPSASVPSNLSTANPRVKRRKPEGSVGPDSGDRNGRPSFGVGMVKGREEEWGEPADIKTKINFLDLPVETLYRYLEHHDLLPRWDASPWSEDPCTPPNALYSAIPIAQSLQPTSRPESASPQHTSTPLPEESKPASNGENLEPEVMDATTNGSAPLTSETPMTEDLSDPNAPNPPLDPETGITPTDPPLNDEPEEPVAPPTTRSRTLPSRKQPTPLPSPPPEIKRGVMTLSDVHAARAVLAEKANSHWIKGLGGGQNQESSTIVAFLYKNKVGHGRLLRVYNPYPTGGV